MKDMLSDIAEKISAVDFTDEARKPKMISKNMKYL